MAIKERDPISGAIIFKQTPEEIRINNERKESRQLKRTVERLENELEELKESLRSAGILI